MKKILTIILGLSIGVLLSAQSKVVKGQITEYNVSTEKTYQVTGIVTNEAGTPVNQVKVMIKDGVGSGTTNAKGEYSVTIGSNDKALVFYYPGMIITELSVSIQSLTVNCTLKKDHSDHSLPGHTSIKTIWFDP